ncbi:MAG: glycoside hydrolase family 5 protein, partial [Spirochaetaceae bacterium]|nr:glycoside hydrolase family 5 protein [Spirochaetaceae bacterium]
FSKTSVFGKATLDLIEKLAFWTVFLKPFPKLTEFWKWLIHLITPCPSAYLRRQAVKSENLAYMASCAALCILLLGACPLEPVEEDTFIEPERLITAKDFVKDMGLGFNIGNSLDSWGGETAWGNVQINRAFIRALKNYGYKTIRLPVTWAENLEPAPDYTIKAAWLDRVETIVNWCLDENLYVIINIHHDGHGNAKSWIQNAQKNYPDNGANVTAVADQLAAVWAQIANRFSHSSDYLIFEAMNEIGFDDLWKRYQGGQAAQKAEAYRILNLLNQTFVNTVRAAGYNNKFRFLLISGYWTDIDNTCDPLFKMPSDNIDDRLTLSVHYYTPWNFAGAGTAATWGTAQDYNTLNSLFNKLKTAFIDNGIPVILGEYNIVNNKLPDKDQRVNWLTRVTQKCIELGICPVLWDNGGKTSSGFHDMGEIYRDTPSVISPALKEVLETVLPLL